ncbi:hypothetical protein [Flavilitoribacter nigricans]|uniref:Uncharacterized protein n=1 Tax=Flavilitoribacter nigricans (strain ATCC 23147 / DSM 23189 / NBRC 102662 / NCIMB 1420 / SS-2) TaxID=1122177 RepID=A0A2D0NHQ5_FLAN2|nr:hypothetical protein [Flavilitoribacter nigricans]PHN07910.1 hypothetical protein CRP01_03920 [Flavilitoribacter nigricans DSM 23189 = NBRC 102662]
MSVFKKMNQALGRFTARIDWPNHLMAFISTLLGVWLAFSLGNYYEHQRERERMTVAMDNVRQEIRKNEGKLKEHVGHLDSLMRAVSAFGKLLNEDLNMVAGTGQMDHFLQEHGWFIDIEEKKPYRDSLYEYDGSLNLNLRYMSISNIAWENTKLMDVLHLVDTETAFKLHGLYGLQAETQRSLTDAIDIVKNLFQNNHDSKTVTRTIVNDLKGQIQFSYSLERALQLNYELILKDLTV